jgi:hypothetical protein
MKNIAFIIFGIACQKTPAESAVEASKEAPVEQVASEKAEDGFQDYGEAFKVEDILTAKALLADPASFVGQTVRVEGKVSDVCQKAGCWLVLSDAEQHMRVTTKDHAFFVDKQGTGSKCEIEGEVIAKEIEQDRVEHFAGEASEGAPIPEHQATGNISYEIVASGIRFYAKK